MNRWCLCLCIYTHCAAYVCACVCMNYCLLGAHISVTDAEFGYFTSTPSLPPSLPPFPSSLSPSLPPSSPLSLYITGSEEQSILPTRCSGGLQVQLFQEIAQPYTQLAEIGQNIIQVLYICIYIFHPNDESWHIDLPVDIRLHGWFDVTNTAIIVDGPVRCFSPVKWLTIMIQCAPTSL